MPRVITLNLCVYGSSIDLENLNQCYLQSLSFNDLVCVQTSLIMTLMLALRIVLSLVVLASALPVSSLTLDIER